MTGLGQLNFIHGMIFETADGRVWEAWSESVIGGFNELLGGDIVGWTNQGLDHFWLNP